MAKKRKPRNIAESPTIVDTSQAIQSRSAREDKSFEDIQLSSDIVDQLDEVAKAYVTRKALFALGYTRRREILQVLMEGPKGTTEIRNVLGMKLSAPNVKGHLDVLVSTGLVSVCELNYELTPVGKRASSLVQDVEDAWLDSFSTEEGSAKRYKILDFLYLQDTSKFDQITAVIGINKSEVHRFLKSLVNAGLVEKGSARFDPYSLTKDGRKFYERLETLSHDLVDLYVEIIARDNEHGLNHLFLVSPSKGLVVIDYEDLVLSIKNRKLVRIE